MGGPRPSRNDFPGGHPPREELGMLDLGPFSGVSVTRVRVMGGDPPTPKSAP